MDIISADILAKVVMMVFNKLDLYGSVDICRLNVTNDSRFIVVAKRPIH